MTMGKPYYIIATRTMGKWFLQWGDYHRSTCVEEVKDSYKCRYRGDELRWAGKDIKILKVEDDTQQAINKAIEELNNG